MSEEPLPHLIVVSGRSRKRVHPESLPDRARASIRAALARGCSAGDVMVRGRIYCWSLAPRPGSEPSAN